jgi:nicotinic acid mononucleotide adenylyltransferase
MTLGVLGGTFDPIHIGHIAAGLRAQEALQLDRVMLVPSHIPADRSTPDEKTRVILIETATPDVSSTEVRRRVRARESIGGLVPDSVATYISTHRLYVEATL